MSQQMMEKAGTTKKEFSENKYYKRHLFSWMLCHPIFLIVYALFCQYAYKLCMYGGVRRRGSVLVVCVLFFVIYLIIYIVRCFRIKVAVNQEADIDKIWFYGFTKKGVYLFDKKRNYYEQNLSKEEKDFVKLKYKKIPRYRYYFWKIPAYILLLVITIMTAFGIYKSSQKYNGKLSWIIEELKTTTYATLEHNNLYADGIQGIFDDINQKEILPENLTIANVFNLHFEKDGTIKTFDMILRGYDEELQYVDTYLISYPSSRGGKISIQKQTYNNVEEYDEEKSIDALLSYGDILPYEEAIAEWDEEEYGVYYLGSRTWNKWDENIFVLGKDGSASPVAWGDEIEITGFSISIFCPDNTDVAPKRYMVGVERSYIASDYGQIGVMEEYFDNAEGERTYFYEVDYFYFNDEKYNTVNETLRQMYEEKKKEYKEFCKADAPDCEIDESITNEAQRTNYYKWYFQYLSYVGDDYVSLLFNDTMYSAGANNPESYITPVTINVKTGEIVTPEEILDMSWDEIREKADISYENEEDFNREWGFYITDTMLRYINRTYDGMEDAIVIDRLK